MRNFSLFRICIAFCVLLHVAVDAFALPMTISSRRIRPTSIKSSPDNVNVNDFATTVSKEEVKSEEKDDGEVVVDFDELVYLYLYV